MEKREYEVMEVEGFRFKVTCKEGERIREVCFIYNRDFALNFTEEMNKQNYYT